MSLMPFQQPVAQRAHALVLGRHLGLGEARRLAEADDLVRGEGARAEAALVAAAVDLRLDAHAGLAAHVERADALRAVDLVRRDGEQVDLELRTSISTRPAPCTASQWKMTPFSRQSSAISHTGWITPISLFTIMIETRMVSGRIAAFSLSRLTRPLIHLEVRRLEALALELAQACRAPPCARSSA